jgi:hypothetical protein
MVRQWLQNYSKLQEESYVTDELVSHSAESRQAENWLSDLSSKRAC